RRKLIEIAQDFMEEAFGTADGRSAMEVHENAETALYNLEALGNAEEARSPAHEAMALAIDAAVKVSGCPKGLIGLTTGFTDLDEITGGFRPGDYVLLAG